MVNQNNKSRYAPISFNFEMPETDVERFPEIIKLHVRYTQLKVTKHLNFIQYENSITHNIGMLFRLDF